jgi:hypothetical protein
MILIIIITIIIIISIYYYFNINIEFYNPKQIGNFLKHDNYFLDMNDINLKLRKISDKNEYIKNINKHFCNFSLLDKIILKYNVNKANNILNNLNYQGFKGSKLNSIPWVIACSKDDYEFGFPHTRQNIIILNKNSIYKKKLYKTLIHERIHIYQRFFPNDVNEFLNINNFKKISKITDTDRINPDTDGNLYSKDNIIYECKIQNNEVKCTNNSFLYEHPYEYMAYLLSNL